MPRDGSNIYHRPPGTDAITDTTIESTKYNASVADVEQDLNLPRPILAGGTGATNATDALNNLKGELAGQIVTNYDSQIWQSGSFYSATTATGAPVAGHAFTGIAYSSDPVPVPPAAPANLNVVLEARDESDTTTPGRKYIREKKAGIWGAWISEDAGSRAAFVAYDTAQTLTYAQREQARSNIAAATIANPAANLIINGDMSVSQEFGTGGVAPVNNTNRYVADQWVFTSSQVANTAVWNTAIGATAVYSGLINQLVIVATTPWSAGNANDYVILQHVIEGQRWAKLGWGTANALPISIGFWIYTTVAGTLALSIRNAASNRSYVVPVSVTAASTWQYKTVTIPGDVTGMWSTDTSIGAVISLCFGSGATLTTPNINVWQAGNFLGHTGISNFFTPANSNVVITGVSLIPGNTPVPLEQSAAIRRDPAEELRLCQRYWENSNGAGGVASTNDPFVAIPTATTSFPATQFKVGKRATPTVAFGFTAGSGAAFAIGQSGFYQNGNHSVPSTFGWSANARL